MKKVLFVAHVDSHILHFHLPYLEMFQKHGYETHVATESDEPIPFCDVKHKIAIKRSPFKPQNLKAIRQLRKIIEEEKFDIIHCHTPMGGVVARLAAKNARKSGTRVIYTAHGFHFYTGAPLLNWVLFYPVEKYLARYTDTLITINDEDYQRAKKKFSKRCADIQYVPGVGVDPKKFDFKMSEKEKLALRKSLGLKKNDFVIIYVAELIPRKNQGLAIRAMKEVIKEKPNAKLLLVGKETKAEPYKKLVKKLNLEDYVIFTGYRKDVPKLMKMSDLAISTSKQEGLPVNLIEAQMCGLPVIATDCRGNRDIVRMGDLVPLRNKKLALTALAAKCENTTNTFGSPKEDFFLEPTISTMHTIYLAPRIAILVPGYLPLPPVRGGAAETLIDDYLKENENQDRIKPFIFSPFDKEAAKESTKYKHASYLYIQSGFLVQILDVALYFICDKVLKIEKSRKYRYIFKRLQYAFKCAVLLRRYNFDIILLENHTTLFLSIKLLGNYSKYRGRYYYHCHNIAPVYPIISREISGTKKVISVSRYRDNYIKTAFNLNGAHRCVVQNCYSSEIQRLTPPGELSEIKEKYKISGNVNLLFIGRIDKDKGIELLIDAFSSIEDQNIKLIIIGAPLFGLKESTDYQRRMYEKIKSDNRIINIGYVAHGELYRYYDLADIVIIPSQVQDSAPLVLLEALAKHKPIIATKCGGIPEYVNDDCATLIELGDSYKEELLLAIKELSANKQKRQAMTVASARQSAKFTSAKYYNSLTNELLRH